MLTPTKNPCPTPDEQTRNNLLSAMRAPAERANAMFKHFRALQRVSPGPRHHHHDHGRRPRHHHTLARFLTRTLVRKAHCHAIDLAEFNDVIVVDSTIRNQSTGIARSRCELLGFGVAPAGGALVPGASVVGEGPGAGGGGDVVGVGGVDLDVVHRPGAPGRPDVGRTELSGLGESFFPRQNEGELMMRPAKIQWALGHRRVASGEFSQTLPECPSMWTSGFVCVGGGSTRGSAAGGGYGPGTRPASRAVSRRVRAGPRRVCGRPVRPGRSRRSGAGRL